MAWVAVDKNGNEFIYENLPFVYKYFWVVDVEDDHFVSLPKGSIKKLTGKELTFEDKPVELK